MSLTVTQRPYQTINGDDSKWNAVAHPLLYKMQRKDFTFNQVNNNGGFIQVQISSVNVTTSFVVGDYIYVQSDNGIYNLFGTITASAFSTHTLITIDQAYVSAAPGGFVNNDDLRALYTVQVYVYDQDGELINEDPFSYAASSVGVLNIDISSIVRSYLMPDNNVDLTDTEGVDSDVFTGFYISYTEVWTGSAESAVTDSTNIFWAALGALQIPSTYGSNLYEYLILDDMKKYDVTISSAAVLTSNATPVDVVPASPTGYVNVPVMFLVYLDYNSIAYATNTAFRFEINGVPVSATITTVLPGTADRFTMVIPIAYDSTTSMLAQAIKFETQTGNPTAGNSPIQVVTFYETVQLV